MTKILQSILQRHRESNNYAAFLMSLILLTIFPLIAAFVPSYSIPIFRAIYTVVIIVGTYTVTTTLRHLSFGVIIGFLAMASYWGRELVSVSEGLSIFPTIIGIAFFSYIVFELYESIRAQKTIDLNVVIGTIIGYLLLGIIGGQFCLLLDTLFPESFTNIMTEQSPYQYYYFSFISLTTVGFGDITPSSDAARSLALLISLTGQIYLTVVIALIIGKFLSR